MDDKCFMEVNCETKKFLNNLNIKTDLDFDAFLNDLIEENKTLKKYKVDAFEIADATSDGIYLSDSSGCVISVNKHYTRITGIEAVDVVGKDIQTIINDKYLSGEYVELQVEPLNGLGTETTSNNNESYFREKPQAICKMVMEQKKEISVMATICIKGENKKVLFIGKPFFDSKGDISYIITVIRELSELGRLQAKLEDVEKKSKKYLNELRYLRNSQLGNEFIGEDATTDKIRKIISDISKTDAPVLITGETGVGKEVVAREIYKKSMRSKRQYIKVNCAVIPESLFESEMFGYERGAFTGALNKEKLGIFEIADGGTILLDEIGEIPIKLQSKLLRVLQEMEITRIGGTKPIDIDVRVIATTNQDLETQIAKGLFREDLFYRLNVIPITISPLRERKDDIASLS